MLAILIIEPVEISMEQLAEKTGYSLASISNALKDIDRIGILKIIHKPKTKKLYFFIEKDFSKHIKFMFDKIYNEVIKPTRERLPDIISRYKGQIKKSNTGMEKLKIIQNYYQYIQKTEEILTHFIKEMEK